MAEGIETQKAWDHLLTLGCRIGQGYFISRPLPPAELDQWLEDASVDAGTARPRRVDGVVRLVPAPRIQVVSLASHHPPRKGRYSSTVDTHTRSIETGGQRARIYDAGEGCPVVVLHGWGGRIESMTPVLNCLSGGFRVIAFDLPGFGESPLPTGVWGTPDYAAFIRDSLHDLGVDRAMFVGHSFGAKVSLYLAATHQDLVEKLVAQGSSGLRTPPSLRARIKRSVSKGARLVGTAGPPGRTIRDAVYQRIQSEDYKNAGPLRPIFVKVVNEDIAGLLPRITAPTLLVWGTEDEAVPLSHAKKMESLIRDSGLVLFEGAGHFAYLDESDRFCRVVNHFFSQGVS